MAEDEYRELSTALNDLSKDVVKGLVALRSVAGDNKSDIARVEQRIQTRLDEMREKVEKLIRSEAAHGERLKLLEGKRDRKEDTKAEVQRESVKGRWAFWVAVAGGAFGVIGTIAQIVARALGWGS